MSTSNQLRAIVQACEDFADLGNVTVLIVVAKPSGDGEHDMLVSLPADRELAANMVKIAELELAKVVGLVSDS